MKQRGSLFWIIFLLAALFLGPTMILTRSDSDAGAETDLRALVEQEQLVDAPAAVSPSLDKP